MIQHTSESALQCGCSKNNHLNKEDFFRYFLVKMNKYLIKYFRQRIRDLLQKTNYTHLVIKCGKYNK